jgi:hypothetical protein
MIAQHEKRVRFLTLFSCKRLRLRNVPSEGVPYDTVRIAVTDTLDCCRDASDCCSCPLWPAQPTGGSVQQALVLSAVWRLHDKGVVGVQGVCIQTGCTDRVCVQGVEGVQGVQGIIYSGV